jgi:hypothetical protein
LATPTASAISPISSVRMPPPASKIPAVPPSRASVITFQAPASSSSAATRPFVAPYSTDESSSPPREDGEVAGEAGDQPEVPRDVHGPVRDLDVRETEVGEPPLYSSSLS